MVHYSFDSFNCLSRDAKRMTTTELSEPNLSAESSLLQKQSLESECELCGGATRPWLTLPGDWRRRGRPERFRLVWCDDCDYGSLMPRPTPSELASFYQVDDYYTHQAPQHGRAGRTLADRLLTRLAWSIDRRRDVELQASGLERYGIRPPGALCDIGCGNGGLLRRMATAGFTVVGVEPDADACRAATAGGMRVVRGSAEDLPPEIATARFDAVTMMHVLEHALDPLAAVENAARLLAPGGVFLVETPNNGCSGARAAGTHWRWLDVPRHVNFFTVRSLAAVCERAGLEIVGVDYNGYTRQFGGEWIAEEREIRKRLAALDDAEATPSSPPNSRLRAAALLARTAFARDELKYDSIRVAARKR